MIVVLVILSVVLALPLLLVVAIVLGPVILGIVCAVGFGLIVSFIGNLAIGLWVLGHSLERAGQRYMQHARVPHPGR